MSERAKFLVLKRAHSEGEPIGNLEQLLRSLFQKLPTPRQRVVKVDLLRSVVFARLDDGPQNDGIFLRVSEFEAGAIGSINFEYTNTAADIEEVLPPKDQHFLRGEITLFVRGDDIIACGMANKNVMLSSALQELARTNALADEAFRIRVEDVPNRQTLSSLRDVGVSEVDLGVTGYLANLPVPERSGWDRVARSIFATPAKNEALAKRKNLTGRIKIKRGKFLKDEIKKDEWLTGVGQAIVESDVEESYSIKLEDGRVLTNKNLKLIKKVRVRRYANTVSYEHMQLHMHNYWVELDKLGLVGE